MMYKSTTHAHDP